MCSATVVKAIFIIVCVQYETSSSLSESRSFRTQVRLIPQPVLFCHVELYRIPRCRPHRLFTVSLSLVSLINDMSVLYSSRKILRSSVWVTNALILKEAYSKPLWNGKSEIGSLPLSVFIRNSVLHLVHLPGTKFVESAYYYSKVVFKFLKMF